MLLHAMDVIRNTASIHSTVTNRVDRLRPDEQLTLKVASVGGLTIYLDLLQVGGWVWMCVGVVVVCVGGWLSVWESKDGRRAGHLWLPALGSTCAVTRRYAASPNLYLQR